MKEMTEQGESQAHMRYLHVANKADLVLILNTGWSLRLNER